MSMKNSYKIFLVVNLILFIGYAIYATRAKEKIINEGKLVLLKLAPVDPRSLMQGDYMVLNYEISNNLPENTPHKGFVILKELEDGAFRALKFQNFLNDLKENEIAVEFIKIDSWQNSVKIGAESYFFEEGHAKKYEKAVYGGLRVDNKGNSVLVGLFDENKKLIN